MELKGSPSIIREEDDQGQEGRAGDPIPFPKFHWTVQFPLPNQPPPFACFPDFQPFIYLQFPFLFSHSILERSEEDKSKSNPTFSQAIKVPNLSLYLFLSFSDSQCGKVFQLSHPSACLNATLYPFLLTFLP